MKRVVLLALALILCSCESMQRWSLNASPQPQETAPPPPPPQRAKPGVHTVQRPPANVSSAGPLKTAMVGGYMDAQEKDLRVILRGAAIRRIADDLIVSIPDKTLFSNENLSGQGSRSMERLAELLRHYDHSAVQVGGYLDTAGPEAQNLATSSERARKVADTLVADGVAASRISYQGYGSQHLRIATGPGRAEPRNRRIEIRIIAHPQA